MFYAKIKNLASDTAPNVLVSAKRIVTKKTSLKDIPIEKELCLFIFPTLNRGRTE